MIGIVSVIYNKLDFVQATVEAVLTKTRPPFIYVLIYNDSPYPGVKKYVRSLKGVNLVENKENLGVTRALAQGFQLIRNVGCSLMVKVDDDTVIKSEGWNYTFMEAFLRFQDLGILSADIDSGKQTGPSIVEIKGDLRLEVFENSCVGGAFTAYPCWMFEEIGFFKNFGYYGHEDGEFSVRVRNLGFRTAYLQNVKVKHLGRTDVSDPLLDTWKLDTWNGKTRLEFREWRQRKEEKDALRPTAS